MSEPIVLKGPEQTYMFNLLQLKHAMRLTMRTGMQLRQGRVFPYVKKRFGLKGNHEKVYKAFCAMHGLEE